MNKRKTATVAAVTVILVILIVLLSLHGTVSITISNVSVYIGR
jgi:hypothetical protein